ncbi:hypothetical protein FYJ91_00030 [Sphingomonas montanisoli]|uniref:Uncharacterized protein n=1 Tax=Sphingomonas montanisoli TaxID=2606412 RepID=A0A5D9C9Y8_9SPHN|nr:hypothetical protein FYJ91_00030 [Sphingomonas montanisoli]
MWGAIAATAASIIAWRVFRWQRQAEFPVVTCSPRQAVEHDDWIALNIVVRNVTDTAWRSTRMSIKRPRGAKGFSAMLAERTGTFDDLINFQAAERTCSSVFKMGAETAAAGTPRHQHWGGGDVSHETIYLLKSSIRSSKLSMRLSLVSTDAIERRITIAIKRQLEAAAAIA